MSPTLDDVAWPVRTERLLLRRATPADGVPTWAYRSLPRVADWLTALPADRAAYAERWTTTVVTDQTVIVECDAVVVGDLMLRVKDAWSQEEVADQVVGIEAELGWVLDPAHQGQGYAVKAVGELLRVCFEDFRLRRVTAGCFTANEPSWRLMEKLGMRREVHSLRDGLHRTRGWLDGFEYALLAEEWRERRGGHGTPSTS